MQVMWPTAASFPNPSATQNALNEGLCSFRGAKAAHYFYQNVPAHHTIASAAFIAFVPNRVLPLTLTAYFSHYDQ